MKIFRENGIFFYFIASKKNVEKIFIGKMKNFSFSTHFHSILTGYFFLLLSCFVDCVVEIEILAENFPFSGKCEMCELELNSYRKNSTNKRSISVSVCVVVNFPQVALSDFERKST